MRVNRWCVNMVKYDLLPDNMVARWCLQHTHYTTGQQSSFRAAWLFLTDLSGMKMPSTDFYLNFRVSVGCYSMATFKSLSEIMDLIRDICDN